MMPGLLSNNTPDTTTDAKPQSADDVADFFALPDAGDKEPDKKEPDKEEKPPARREKPDDDKEDLEDIELKEGDEDEDKLSLEEKPIKDDDRIEIDTPPRKKEVLAKYPNFYKEFPWFEKMQFRDRQYTELFGSYDDAKEVYDRAQVLDSYEADLLRGNTEAVLKQVKETDTKAFNKLVDNYLPTLAKVDKEAYYEVIGNIGKHIIQEMVKEARSVVGQNKEQGEALNQAALLINQFLFGTSTYTPPRPRVEKTDDKDEQLEQERTNFVRERFETSRNDLQIKVDNTLRATISDYIDRNSEMTAYVKKNAIKDALTMLHSSIGNDTAFRRNLDRLWESAFSDRFSQNSLSRIRSMYLGKAKQLLPAVIKKARAEALKDQTPSERRGKDEDKEEERPSRREPINSGRPRQSGGKLKMEKGESVLDFLSRD